jgi:hypothetical protein
MTGYPSVMVLFTFLLGILYVLVGIIAEYIYEIFLSVKHRPRYLIYEKKSINPAIEVASHSTQKL